MNPRERTLLFALIGIVGFGGFGIGSYVWFVKPFIANRKTIATMTAENQLEEEKWTLFLKERKKLELAKLKSLPITPQDASSEYESYLERMIEQTGLKVISIVQAPATKVKPLNAPPTIKETGHLTMAFTLTARGEWGDLLKFMDLIRETPYEHRIRSMSIDRADGAGKGPTRLLNVSMVIETFLVAGNQNRPGQLPGVDSRYLVSDFIAGQSALAPMGWGLIGNRVMLKNASPTPEDRHYDEIARKNIFVGWTPPTKNPGPPPPPPPPPPPQPPGNIPAFIRLVQTVPTHQEAYLLNLYYKKQEIKFIAKPDSGYDVQRIADDDDTYTFYYMKALRVDSGMMHFQIENHVFTIRLGQTLAEAVGHGPLSIERMDALDLEWDRDWAKQQIKMREERQAPPTKKLISAKGG